MSRRKAEYANPYDTNFIRSISSGREPYGDYWKDNYLNKWSDPGQKTWTDSITTNSPWRVSYPAYPLELPVTEDNAIDWDKLNAAYQRRLLEKSRIDLQPQSPLSPIDMEPKPKSQPKKPTIEPTPSTGTRQFFLDD